MTSWRSPLTLPRKRRRPSQEYGTIAYLVENPGNVPMPRPGAPRLEPPGPLRRRLCVLQSGGRHRCQHAYSHRQRQHCHRNIHGDDHGHLRQFDQFRNDSLTVTAQPNFTPSALPASLSIARGAKGTTAIIINPANGFSGSVTLSASGLHSGALTRQTAISLIVHR